MDIGSQDHVDPGHGEGHGVPDKRVGRQVAVPSPVPDDTFFQQFRSLNIAPSIGNLGSILLLRGNLRAGVLGDGVGVRSEDRVVRHVQEHAVTRVLSNGITMSHQDLCFTLTRR